MVIVSTIKAGLKYRWKWDTSNESRLVRDSYVEEAQS